LRGLMLRGKHGICGRCASDGPGHRQEEEEALCVSSSPLTDIAQGRESREGMIRRSTSLM
jgi:hypothetical protein